MACRRGKNKAAYLKKILRLNAQKMGHDLNELLDSIQIPAKPERAAPTAADSNGPHAKATENAPHELAKTIGAMPEKNDGA